MFWLFRALVVTMSQQPQGSSEGDNLPIMSAYEVKPTSLIGEHGSPQRPSKLDGHTPLFEEGAYTSPSTGYQPYQQDVSPLADVVGSLSPTPEMSEGLHQEQEMTQDEGIISVSSSGVAGSAVAKPAAQEGSQAGGVSQGESAEEQSVVIAAQVKRPRPGSSDIETVLPSFISVGGHNPVGFIQPGQVSSALVPLSATDALIQSELGDTPPEPITVESSQDASVSLNAAADQLPTESPSAVWIDSSVDSATAKVSVVSISSDAIESQHEVSALKADASVPVSSPTTAAQPVNPSIGKPVVDTHGVDVFQPSDHEVIEVSSTLSLSLRAPE